MKLTDNDVAEFCRVYKNSYGEDLALDEARIWAVRLVRLYRLLLQSGPNHPTTALAKSLDRATLQIPPETNSPNK